MIDNFFLRRNHIVLRFVQGLDKLDALYIHRADLLTLGLKSLLGNELFCINSFNFSVFMLSSESDLELRVLVIAECNEIRTFRVGYEAYRSVVAYGKRESLDIE